MIVYFGLLIVNKYFSKYLRTQITKYIFTLFLLLHHNFLSSEIPIETDSYLIGIYL
jgi:hypothetical protein